MDQVSSKTWTLVGMLGIVLFLAIWLKIGHHGTAATPTGSLFSYFMPRPKNFEPGFDLSDRSIDRQFKTLEIPGKFQAAKVDPKKAAEEAKKKAAADAKKKADAEAKKKAALNAAKHQKLAVKTVDTSRDTNLSPTTNQADGEPQLPQGWGAGARQAPIANAADNAPNAGGSAKAEDDLNAAQWRSLLQSAPTAANVARFVAAYNDDKIDATSFYQIVHELLSDSADDRRKGGLAILESTPSELTFEFMVSDASQFSTDVQTSLKTKVAEYSDAAKLGIVNQVLGKATDVNVLLMATTELSAALNQYKILIASAGSTPATATTAATATVAKVSAPSVPVRRLAGGLTAQQFQSFLSNLQKLAKNSNQSLAAQAKNLIALIQALPKA